MKDVRLFEYIHYDCLLSRIGPGIKLSAMIAVCIATAVMPPPYLIMPSALLIPLIATSGKAVRMQLLSMWKLFIFFILTGAVRFITSDSISEGAAFSLRMMLMMISGLLFYSTTRISELRRSLSRLFSCIPFINGRRIAELLAMTIAFLPVIFKTMNELQQARSSRCFKARKNIIRTIKLTSIPLMINMFLKTDEMTDAWYSRGYNPPS